MSHTLEATLIIPTSLSLLCLAVLKFPQEYERGSRTATEAAIFHQTQAVLYEPLAGAYVRGVRTSPDLLVSFVLQSTDAIGQISELVEGRFSP